jgi:formylglycine-generating enzyme required for sulfatase activity
MRRSRFFLRTRAGAVALSVLAVLGCNDPNVGVSLSGDAPTGQLPGSINEANAPVVILDLVSGTRTTALELTDLTSNPLYVTDQMVFRRVSGPGGTYLLGVFEVTQAQWRRIAPASSQPWELVDAALVGSAAQGDAMPAFNLSNDDIDAALTAFNAGKVVQVALPSEAQWELACAAGTTSAWSWGDVSDRATVMSNARVAETSSTGGPQAVGTLAANAWGFHDMHGNVWEWAGAGTGARLRGGSWHDGAELAKTVNALGTAQGVYRDTHHALAGVRLVLRQ